MAPLDLAFKTIIRKHWRPPAAKPEASMATVWVPNILSPGNFPYLRFSARHEVSVGLGATCSEQKSLDLVSIESKLKCLLFETNMGLFSPPKPEDYRPVETFHPSSLTLPVSKLSIFQNSVHRTLYSMVSTSENGQFSQKQAFWVENMES